MKNVITFFPKKGISVPVDIPGYTQQVINDVRKKLTVVHNLDTRRFLKAVEEELFRVIHGRSTRDGAKLIVLFYLSAGLDDIEVGLTENDMIQLRVTSDEPRVIQLAKSIEIMLEGYSMMLNVHQAVGETGTNAETTITRFAKW